MGSVGKVVCVVFLVLMFLGVSIIDNVASATSKEENYQVKEWFKNHTYKVKVIHKYTYTGKDLTINVTYLVIDDKAPKALKNKKIKVKSYKIKLKKKNLSIENINKVLPREYKIPSDKIYLLKTQKYISVNKGTTSAIILQEDDPPNWCNWYPALPRYAYSMHILDEGWIVKIIYIAEDPINIVFLNQVSKSTVAIELRDYESSTDDDWPEPTFGFDLYVYDCTNGVWKKQDFEYIEGDDEPWRGRDDYDRVHVRFWNVYSPQYSYVTVANAHLEDAQIPEHVVLHIDSDYSYGYEKGEEAFSEEFKGGTYNKKARWWAWNKNVYPYLKVFSTKNDADAFGDIITSYYVDTDYYWDVRNDNIDLDNEDVPSKGYTGDGRATTIKLL